MYVSTHVFNHEILVAIDGNFPLKPSPKEPLTGCLRQPRGGFGLEELMLQLLHVLTLDAQ